MFWVRVITLLGVLLCLAALAALPSLAHMAPSGWTYDSTCCEGQDCAPVPAGSVTATSEGWRVEIAPGQHPLVNTRLVEVIPFDDARILPSGDAEFHVCTRGPRVFCLYIPMGQPVV